MIPIKTASSGQVIVKLRKGLGSKSILGNSASTFPFSSLWIFDHD